METKELNLCELLKGHEGEEFYSSVCGNTKLCKIVVDKSVKFPIITEKNHIYTKDGKYYEEGECLLFPSKYQRDWGKWADEQKPKVPKTWRNCKRNPVEVSQEDIELIQEVSDNIDWEQRRYEIAKAAMQGILSIEGITVLGCKVAKQAIICADALIKELKGEQND